MENIEKDIIEEMIEEAKRRKYFYVKTIDYNINRIKEYKKMLNYKKEQVQKSKTQDVKVPHRFKKIEDVVCKEDLKKFYYNLFFFGFIHYDNRIGYLLSNNKDFYLKITLYTDNYLTDGEIIKSLPDKTKYEEELYITKEMAEEVLNADNMMKDDYENSQVLDRIK